MDKSGETCNARHHRSYHRSYYDDTWYTNQQVNDDTWYFHKKLCNADESHWKGQFQVSRTRKKTPHPTICQRLWKAPQGPLKTVSKSEFRMWFFKQKVKKNVNQQELLYIYTYISIIYIKSKSYLTGWSLNAGARLQLAGPPALVKERNLEPTKLGS